jgi:DNA mismatch endonuclease (patch repair protein)
MADKVGAGKRSWIMSRIRGKDTAPEMLVRRLAHGMGFRFRLHRKDLPGSPDLVFASLGKVVFVHGCFWHGHRCKEGSRRPRSNRAYWIPKIEANQRRDRRARRALQRAGWATLVVWECHLREPEAVAERLFKFLTG